jgi:hypothetical protein
MQAQTWYAVELAQRIAFEMGLGEDMGWTYRLVYSPDGKRARVLVYDGRGEYVADVCGY